MRSDSSAIYKKGAIALLFPVSVGLIFGARACLRYQLRSSERAAVQRELDMRREIEELGVEIDQRERAERRAGRPARRESGIGARSAELPAPASQPTREVATGQGQPDAIVADRTHVYWVNTIAGELVAAARATGSDADAGAAPEPKVLARELPLLSPRHAPTLAHDDTHLYFVTSGTREGRGDDGAVMKLPKKGGTPVTLASGQPSPNAIAVRGNTVVWVRNAPKTDALPMPRPDAARAGGPDAGEDGGEAAVVRASTAGAKATVLATAKRPCGLALDDTHAYFIEQTKPAGVVRVPLRGGAKERIVTSGGSLGCALAVTKDRVFWTIPNDDTVMTATKDGSETDVFAFVKSRPAALVATERALFVLAEATPHALTDAGTLYEVPFEEASSPRVLATDQPGPNGLTVLGNDVFFTSWSQENEDGQVRALLRTAALGSPN
jgi:sugar lactone lactonase YvrE